MGITDKLFNRYRNMNRKRGPVTQHSQEQGKFGETALSKNPNLPIFDNAQNNIAEIIDRRSVVSQYQTPTSLASSDAFFSSLFTGVNAVPIYTNKSERIRQYRTMAMYPECDFCLCELADDVIHDDETGRFIKLNIPDEKTHLDDDKRKVLQNVFDRFIGLFRFRDDGFNLIKRFLTDGELAFENIINPQKPKLGIIGVKYLPAEYYETILNENTGRPIGIVFDKEKLNMDLKNILSNSCIGARAVFNSMITTQANVYNSKENSIPLLYPQITYISSGDMSTDGLISFPLIEKCKQAYHQLALMQDAAVILRVTRAPERLLFNISTGGMSDKAARQRILQFINELKSKKIVSSSMEGGGKDGDIRSVYNPVTMLESYFFGKSNANDGTTVESVGSSADYEQIADIEFFLRRLFKQFKVPFSRYKTPENSLERDDTITYEEYSMARMIIRIQRRFALGLTRSWITHLKLLGIWKQYSLKESDFTIDFVTPILYDLYQTQKLVTAKMDTYKAVVDQEELSKINAMKSILKMTDEEIDQNFRNLIKEKQLVALADYYADKISDDNKPLDFESPLRLSGNNKGKEGDEGGEGGGDSDDQTSSDETSSGGDDNAEPSFGLGN